MSGYESDSSDSEGGYTKTNVTLGDATKEPLDDTINQLGGHPTWLDDKTAPPGNLAKCKCCNGLLTLLVEVNGDSPKPFPDHERRLYLLGCRKKVCRRKEGSVRGFRAIRASNVLNNNPAPTPAPTQPAPAERKPQMDLGSSLFGTKSTNGSSPLNPFSNTGSNPFSTSSNPFASASSLAAKPAQQATQPAPEPSSTADLPETFASKARITNPEPAPTVSGPAEPWPARSSFPEPYPRYYIDPYTEELDDSVLEVPQQTRIDMDIDGGEGASNTTGGSGQEDKEIFESSMDRTFQKFADRLAQNPEQVLRYEFGGQPLLYSNRDLVGKMLEGPTGQGKVRSVGSRVPRCTNCGAERVFELQLTPHAIVDLEAEELGIEGMEWGTIILMVCGKDCVPRGVGAGEVGYAEEWVGVQWEEVIKYGPPKGANGRLQ